MKAPLLVRPLTDAERAAVELGLRSSNAFTLRRSQIIAASARGEHIPRIARSLSCNEQTVRNAIHAFHRQGVTALAKRSSAVHTEQAAFTPTAAEQLRALLHRSPRDFGHRTSLWTLDLAAEEAFKQGLTTTRVTGETVRATLARLGVRWLRAKTWITTRCGGRRSRWTAPRIHHSSRTGSRWAGCGSPNAQRVPHATRAVARGWSSRPAAVR